MSTTEKKWPHWAMPSGRPITKNRHIKLLVSEGMNLLDAWRESVEHWPKEVAEKYLKGAQ